MNYIQLYAQTQGATGSTDYVELDLYESDPIRMTKSVQSLTDPGIATSAYSQTFRLPSTDTNIKYFKAVFNVNVENYDPTLKANAYINIDGQFYTAGSIRLIKTFTNAQKNIHEFEIQFLGETRTFSGVVGGKFLADLDLSDLAHNKNLFNIITSWNANLSTPFKLLDGDIIYPLAEWGYDYGATAPVQSTLAKYDPTIAPKGFTNIANPLNQNQFFPAIRLKRIWDRIFEESGFTYDSDFIEDENFSFFSRLYYMGSAEASAEYTPIATIFDNTWGTVRFVPMNNAYYRLVYDTSPVILDTYNAYNPVSGVYIAPYNSLQYLFTLTVSFDYSTLGSVGNSQAFFRLVRKRAGVTTVVSANTQFVPNLVTINTTGQVIDLAVVLNTSNVLAGDEYTFEVLFPSSQFRFVRIWGSEINLSGNIASNPVAIFPKDQYTQIDFLRSITKKFNLIWEPDPNNPNNFIIEPWNDWIGRGTQRDWSSIMDSALDQDIEPLFYTQPRTLIYKDSAEADLYNFSFEQEAKQVFGQLNLESPIEVISGESKIETMFAPVPLAPIANSDTFLIPHFAKDTEAQRQPIQVKPRLVFYNGLVNNPASITSWYIENDIGLATAVASYPLVSNFDSFPFDNLSFDINWTNSKQFWNPGTNGGITGQTSFTAYTEFWQNWYEATYSKFSRRMTATFVLDVSDLKDLRFNDLIFIKDSWWLPVKYEDFGLGYKQKVKVELVKYWPPIGINIGSTGPGGGPDLYAQPNLCFGNTICEACCCADLRVTLWTDNRDITLSTFAFASSGGILPAQGYYSDGTNSLEISGSGAILSIGNCEICDCSPVIVESPVEISLCYANSPCEAFCCEGATGTFYIETAGLSGSTQIFSTPEGAPSEINTWFSDGTTIVLTGSNGYTIVQEADPSNCDCFQLENFGFFGFGSGATGITGACCIAGVTGSDGINSVWYDDPNFLDSSVFYFDSTQTLPVGPSGDPFYISDGENYITVTESNAGATGSCIGITCDNRTLDVEVTLVNETGSAVELTATGFICFDLTNFYFATQNVSSGGPFTDTYTDFYAPGTLFQYSVVPDAAGTVNASVLENGEIIYTETVALSASESYTTPSFAINSNPWEVIFSWEP